LVITGTGSGSEIGVGVSGASINLPERAQDIDGHRLVIAFKTDGENLPNTLRLFVGNSNYGTYRSWGFTATDYGTVDGWRLYERMTTLGNEYGSGTVDYTSPVRAKVNVYTTATVKAGAIWIAACWALPKPRKSVIFTVDDAYDDCVWLASEAKPRGVPLSIGAIKDLVGAAGYMTEAELLAAQNDASGLFEITNHSTNNDAFSSIGLSEYAGNVDECRDYLLGIGIPEASANVHAYVGGSSDATLWAEMESRGYSSARTSTAPGSGALNANIALGASGRPMFNIPQTANLSSPYTLDTVKAQIEAAIEGGSAFIMGHRFEATASSIGWVNGYDEDHGTLDLLDWLAEKRDTEGWRLMRWSDWHRAMTTGNDVA